MRILIALLLLTFSFPALAADKEKESVYDRVMRTGTIRCGYSPWPPYFDVNPNTGEITGVSKDASDAAAKLLGLDIEYIEIVLGQQIQDLNSGKIDAMCGDGPWVISAIKHIDYTNSFFYVGVYLYGRVNEERFKSFDDFNNQDITFVGIDGDASTDLVSSNFPKSKLSSLPTISDPSQMLINVATNKADLVIIDPLSTKRYMDNNPDKLKKIWLAPVTTYGAGFSVRKGEQEFLNMLNEAIKATINMGATERITKKYDPDGTFFLPASKPYTVPK